MVLRNHESSTVTLTLREQIRAHIYNGLQSWSDQATTEDLLRIYQDQIASFLVTEQVRSALAVDPFEHLREHVPSKVMEQLRSSLTVTDHHSVRTMEGYVRTEAQVRFSPFQRRRNGTEVELHFHYTRPVVPPIRVSYIIEMTTLAATKPPQPLLWIHIDAVSAVPSHRHAIRSDDCWSDMDDDDDGDDIDNDSKCQSVSSPDLSHTEKDIAPIAPSSPLSMGTDQDVDHYEAGMDPEVVSHLVHALQLGSMDDVTVFFLLMTFPFYEHEWDIVGYLLEAVFDSEKDDEGTNVT